MFVPEDDAPNDLQSITVHARSTLRRARYGGLARRPPRSGIVSLRVRTVRETHFSNVCRSSEYCHQGMSNASTKCKWLSTSASGSNWSTSFSPWSCIASYTLRSTALDTKPVWSGSGSPSDAQNGQITRTLLHQVVLCEELHRCRYCVLVDFILADELLEERERVGPYSLKAVLAERLRRTR